MALITSGLWVIRCAQMAVLVSRVIYTEDIGRCFEQLEEGNDNALKDYWDKCSFLETNDNDGACMHVSAVRLIVVCLSKHRRCQAQLNNLSDMINGELTSGDRKKIITLVTIDVHGRDVCNRLTLERCETAECFQWQSQLRYRLDEVSGDCWINLCDYNEPYTYEYIGNCGALVITPLTDRCYITLTQAARLILGGAPAGPASR